MQFIDIGVNLTNNSLLVDIDAVLERAANALSASIQNSCAAYFGP